MIGRSVLFSSSSVEWATPRDLYQSLDTEFGFDFDPCPLGGGFDGLATSWAGRRVFCNPPYRRAEMARWLEKRREALLAVYLVPSRTDTRWWHEHAMKAQEIRFIRGRLRFGDAKTGAPFPSAVLIYRQSNPKEGDSCTLARQSN